MFIAAGADRERAAFLNRALKMPVIAGVTQDEGTALGAHVTVGDQIPNINMAIHGVLLPGGKPVIIFVHGMRYLHLMQCSVHLPVANDVFKTTLCCWRGALSYTNAGI